MEERLKARRKRRWKNFSTLKRKGQRKEEITGMKEPEGEGI